MVRVLGPLELWNPSWTVVEPHGLAPGSTSSSLDPASPRSPARLPGPPLAFAGAGSPEPGRA